MWMNMWNWDSHIISNADICYNNRGIKVIEGFNGNGVKILHITLNIMSPVVERKPIWKGIYESIT